MVKGEVVDAEVVDSESDELDPTDLRALFFRKHKLTPEQRQQVEADLKGLVKDAHESRSDLDNLLVHWNDLAEGISPPKNFPWPNSSNLHIPLTETKLNELHSAARSTVLRTDQVYYVKSIGNPLEPQLTSKVEAYLNYKVTTELGLVGKFSEAVWVAARDGTAIAHVYYYEDWKTVPKIKSYRSLDEFLKAYPEVKGSGLTKAQYKKVLDKFAAGAKVVRLLEEVEECVYRGPKVDIIELQDFLMSPMTAIRTDYARLVGQVVTFRAPELRAKGQYEDWDEADVKRVTDSNDEGRKEASVTVKDQIEGISRTYYDREKNGDIVIYNGIYRADLDGDGLEERYLVYFHYLSGTLLGDPICYPYVHGRDCFVPIRVKKRPKRFLGRGLCQMLDDMNIEVNAQHNQRIDSRTISTVPSFKAKNTARGEFDPSRPDSRFFPGKVFYLTDLNSVQQFDLKQTDLGESMQEETALMSLADRLIGAAAIASGQRDPRDPRGAAAKDRMALNSVGARMDDYFEELSGEGVDNEGLNAVGEQVFAILYQFFADDEIIPLAAPGAAPTPAFLSVPLTPANGPLGTGPAAAPAASGGPALVPGAMPPGAPLAAAPGVGPGAAAPLAQPPLALPGGAPLSPTMLPAAPPPTATITLEDLEKVQGRVRIGLAKISMAQNPDVALMRFMQVYSLLAMDPLVGGNPKGRLALDRTLLELSRTPNADQYLPPDPQTAQQWMMMQQMILAGAEHAKGGRPGARTRGVGKQPSAGGMAGGPGANGPRAGG